MNRKAPITNALAITLTVFILLSNESSVAQQSCSKVFTTSSISVSAQFTQAILNDFEASALKLYKTSGFKSNQEIIKASESSTGPMGELYRHALDILGNEKLLIGTRLPVKIRAKIARDGFLNSHEAGDSQGSVLGRNSIEASYSNKTAEEWNALPDEIKPKYAAIYPKPESGLLSPESLDKYTGSDKYYFKLDRIRDRITVTPGDSLNRFKFWQGWGFEPKAPEYWDQAFIPWKHRFLLIPCLAQGLKEGRVGLPKIAPVNKDMKSDEYGYQPEIIGEGNLAPYKMKWTPNMDYLEVQIWGKLTLDDVAVFEYGTSPPKGPLLKELLRRGIEIRDGRKTIPSLVPMDTSM